MATTTFLFVDQVGSTEQLTRLGDADAHEVRQALFHLLRQATEVAGGHEVDFTGDGLFCAFDGAAEAVDAAVDMQQLVGSFNARRPEGQRLAVRCGLNAGEPLESEGGGYFGVAVVVAARLCSAAGAGQVLVSALVRGLVEPRGMHGFQTVGELDLKGVPRPVDASAVDWAPDARRPPVPAVLTPTGATVPFVGRRRELDAVSAAWHRACRGERQLVAVTGDRGAGVSRLLAEAACRLHEAGATVWAGCGRGAEGWLAPWVEAVGDWTVAVSGAELRLALGSRTADLLRLVPELAGRVTVAPGPSPAEPSAQLVVVADAIDEVAARWSAVEPLVVVLDGLEDTDPGSLGVLRRLAGSSRSGRVLVLVGYAPAGVGASRLLAAMQECRPDAELRLSGLADDEVKVLAESAAGELMDGATVRAVVAGSGGNPSVVLEMARAHRELGLARQVQEAVDRSGELRTDLRLQRQEITLALRELQQLREVGDGRGPARLDPEGTPPVTGSCPYRGLPAFRTEDADTFFGRDALVAEMVAALLSSRWLAVVGPSGSGKSSVVRAGLLPALSRGGLPGSAAWAVAVCLPGPDPLGSLAAALVGHVLAGEGRRRLEHESLAALAVELTGDVRTVLVVDQFEELWTSAPEPARQRALDLLVEAATGEDHRVLVVVCLRADYYGRTAEHPGLAALLAGSQVLVSPMTTPELRAAVELPARAGGWQLEPGLAETVIDDVVGEPGALPLLSTAMLETWERRRGRSLTLAGYAETGGARGAIAALADATLDDLPPDDQEVARRLLLRLAAPTADGVDVARPARLAELVVDEPGRRVLGRLAERRLVVVGETTAQVAHEALLREWPRLRRWLEADRDGRRLHQQIATTAGDWEAAGREDGALLRGARLAAAADWRADHEPDLTAVEREYLDASLSARDRDLRRAHRTTRRFQALAVVLVVLLAGAAVATGFAVVRSREAAARASDAVARGVAAQAIAASRSSVDTALLLAVEGYRRSPSLDTENGLLTALNAARYLTRYRDGLPPGPADTALSPDGTTLAVLTTPGDLRLYDARTWQPRSEPLVRGVKSPGWLAFDPSGHQLAYTDATGAHVVDVRTGAPVGPPLSGVPAARLSFTGDGAVALIDGGQIDTVVRTVDRRTGRQLAALPANTGALRPGADEMAVVLPTQTTLVQRYRLDGTPIGRPASLPGGAAFRVAYTPDGSRLLVITVDGVSTLLDPDTLAPVGRPIDAGVTGVAQSGTYGGDNVVDAEFSPRGDLVALTLSSGTVVVAATADGVVRASLGNLGQAAVVTFLDEHRLLASTALRTAEYDLGEDTQLGTSTVLPGTISRLLAEPGSDRAVTGQRQGLVQVDPTGRVLPAPGRLGVETEGPMALSPDGRLVAALGYPPGYHFSRPPDAGLPPLDVLHGILVVADRASGQVLVRTPVAGDAGAPVEGAMAFSPDGRRLAVGTWGGVVTVLDSATGAVLAERTTEAGGVRVLRWSADGTVLQEGGADGVLHFLDPAGLRTATAVPLSPGVSLNAAVPVPGTRLLVVATDRGQVFSVDLDRRVEVGEPLAAQAAMILGLAVAPDGSRIAAVSWDGALRLWDRASGRAVGPPLEAHGDYTRAVVWPDARHLLTGSFVGGLTAWDMSPADWVSRACALAGRDLTAAEWHRYLPDQPYRRTCAAP